VVTTSRVAAKLVLLACEGACHVRFLSRANGSKNLVFSRDGFERVGGSLVPATNWMTAGASPSSLHWSTSCGAFAVPLL